MNEFIQLRRRVLENENPTMFSLHFLEAYMNTYKSHNFKEHLLFKRIKHIKKLSLQTDIHEKQLLNALYNLGENAYLDRLIVNLVINNHQQVTDNLFADS